MTGTQLSGGAALAAMLGGGLRVVAALPLGLAAARAELLYDAIDALLLLGLIGVYLARARALGAIGFGAFVVALCSLSFIGGPDADPWGFSTYQVGAATLTLALAALSVAWLRAGAGRSGAPLAWLASLVLGAGAGHVPGLGAERAFALAGASFGLGFVLAGAELWSIRGAR